MIVETLKNSSLGKDLNDSEIRKLAGLFGEKRLEEGKTVFVENMAGESLYLIGQGTVQISRMLAEGEERTLVILAPEDVFGEMALIEEAPRSATARVAENALLLTLKRRDFDNLCAQDPALGLKLLRNIVRTFSRRLRDNEDEYREMLIWSQKAEGP